MGYAVAAPQKSGFFRRGGARPTVLSSAQIHGFSRRCRIGAYVMVPGLPRLVPRFGCRPWYFLSGISIGYQGYQGCHGFCGGRGACARLCARVRVREKNYGNPGNYGNALMYKAFFLPPVAREPWHNRGNPGSAEAL